MQETENQAMENSEVAVEEPIVETQPTEEIENEEAAPEEAEQEAEEEVEAEDNEEEEKEVDAEGEEEKFPKKAERALERRNKKINKLRAEKTELEKELAEYRSQGKPSEQINEAPQPDGLTEPREEDFEDYAEFLEAKGEYKVRKEYAVKEAQAQEQQFAESQQQWVQERAKYVDDRAAEAVKTIPELDGLYQENQDIIEGYSDTTKLAFLEAEKPELAFYALAQEGKLEELDSLSPTGVARAIALAEIRGEKLSKSRPITKAPAPIKPVKGTATRKKTLDDMSPSELLDHLKKSKRK